MWQKKFVMIAPLSDVCYNLRRGGLALMTKRSAKVTAHRSKAIF